MKIFFGILIFIVIFGLIANIWKYFKERKIVRGILLSILSVIVLSVAIPTFFGSSEDEKSSKDKVASDKKTEEHKKNEDKDTDKNENKSKEDKTSKEENKNNNDSKKEKSSKSDKQNNKEKQEVTLSRVVDGDTVKLNYKGKEETFRLLLIDTPETKDPRKGVQPYGKKATHKMKDLVEYSPNLKIQFDKGDKKDKYGRYLVYLYADGQMVNDELAREGLARVKYIYPPNNTYEDKLKASQKKAQEEKLNIWSDDEPPTGEQSTEEPETTEDPQSDDFETDSDIDTPENNEIPDKPDTSSDSSNSSNSDNAQPGEITKDMPGYDASKDRDHDGIINEK